MAVLGKRGGIVMPILRCASLLVLLIISAVWSVSLQWNISGQWPDMANGGSGSGCTIGVSRGLVFWYDDVAWKPGNLLQRLKHLYPANDDLLGWPPYLLEPSRPRFVRLWPLWGAAALATGATWLPAPIRRIARRRRGQCVLCGYDLRGLPRGTTCPECGNVAAKRRI